jgi:hypothetical protein
VGRLIKIAGKLNLMTRVTLIKPEAKKTSAAIVAKSQKALASMA